MTYGFSKEKKKTIQLIMTRAGQMPRGQIDEKIPSRSFVSPGQGSSVSVVKRLSPPQT